ncbi:hypothetical protein MNBD_GAMMA16-1932 [hydrothermal vent metagenome]|uniref:Uncharacterized protein n=1 Tax=hydrothermal vent metagenome TaxID=652676 RepID=A0A3B0YTX2_9ZZZZ
MKATDKERVRAHWFIYWNVWVRLLVSATQEQLIKQDNRSEGLLNGYF